MNDNQDYNETYWTKNDLLIIGRFLFIVFISVIASVVTNLTLYWLGW